MLGILDLWGVEKMEHMRSVNWFKKYRHKKELPLLTLLVIINLLVVVGVVIATVLGIENGSEYILSGVVIIIAVIFGLGKYYAEAQVYSVRLSRTQFPEIYEIADSFSVELNLEKTPEIYLRQGNGVLNAFAARFINKNYIVLHAEIFETAYMQDRDMSALAFIIGHELGHISLGHTKMRKMFATLFTKAIPFIGSAYSRACEYSCDRIAAELAPEGKQTGLMLLCAGRNLYKKVDIDVYLNELEPSGIFVWFVNAMASHPVLSRRIRALNGLCESKLF